MNNLESNFLKVIQRLQTGEWQSVATLCKHCQLSSQDLAQLGQQLIDRGIDLQRDPQQGYRLTTSISLVDKHQVNDLLSPQTRRRIQLECFTILDSTNTYLSHLPATAEPNYRICVAEELSAGKGRLQRRWHAPFGQNLYFSCRTRLTKPISKCQGLTLVTGLATVKTLKKFVETPWQIKWPNDVMAQQKKCAGCLLEVVSSAKDYCDVIIGIGINVNMQPSENLPIDQPWTSMAILAKKNFDRNLILSELIENLLDTVDKFNRWDLKFFKEQWQSFDFLAGKSIRLRHHQQEFHGKAMGIDDNGLLLVENDSQGLCRFSAGDTTLLK